MSKIAIVTDSNSGITQAEGARRGIHVLPMPFMIDEVTYYEDIDLTQEQFYEKLKSGANIATSQPSPDSVTSLWDKLLQEYDEIVHIPMSSGLSGSCQSAMAFAADYDGRVQVVNNQRISVTQRQSALDALQLAAAGKDAAQIKEFLENDKFNKLIDCVISLNQKIADDDSLGEGFCIGHSYFCDIEEIKENTLTDIVEFEIIPLLKEYWFDEPSKVKEWSDRLRSAVK